MSFRYSSAAALLISTLVLAGCTGQGVSNEEKQGTPTASSESSGGAREIDVVPASGVTITGDGYSFRVPEGWSNVDLEDVSGAKPDSIAQNDVKGSTPCLVANVNKRPEGVLPPDEAEKLLMDELAANGSTDIELRDRVLVAGGAAPHATFSDDSQGVSYLFERYFVSSDDQSYMITFNCGSTPESERQALAESVLTTWEWSD